VGSIQHVFHHVVIKIRQLFLRPSFCLTSTLLETGVGANDCKCSWDQRPNTNTDPWGRCLASAIARQAHWPRGYRAPQCQFQLELFKLKYNYYCQQCHVHKDKYVRLALTAKYTQSNLNSIIKVDKVQNQLEIFYSLVQLDVMSAVRSTPCHTIYLQFDNSAHALEIRALKSPNCVVQCALDFTS
jgi:hypothetical protein